MAAMGASVQDYQPDNGYVAPIYAIRRYLPKGGARGVDDDFTSQLMSRKKPRLSRGPSCNTPLQLSSSKKRSRRRRRSRGYSHTPLQLTSTNKKARRRSRGSNHLTSQLVTLNEPSQYRFGRGDWNAAGAVLQEYNLHHPSLHYNYRQLNAFDHQRHANQAQTGSTSRHLGTLSQGGPHLGPLQQGLFRQENHQYKVWHHPQHGLFEQENLYGPPLLNHGRVNIRQPLGAVDTNTREQSQAAKKRHLSLQSEYYSGISFLFHFRQLYHLTLN